MQEKRCKKWKDFVRTWSQALCKSMVVTNHNWKPAHFWNLKALFEKLQPFLMTPNSYWLRKHTFWSAKEGQADGYRMGILAECNASYANHTTASHFNTEENLPLEVAAAVIKPPPIPENSPGTACGTQPGNELPCWPLSLLNKAMSTNHSSWKMLRKQAITLYSF